MWWEDDIERGGCARGVLVRVGEEGSGKSGLEGAGPGPTPGEDKVATSMGG